MPAHCPADRHAAWPLVCALHGAAGSRDPPGKRHPQRKTGSRSAAGTVAGSPAGRHRPVCPLRLFGCHARRRTSAGSGAAEFFLRTGPAKSVCPGNPAGPDCGAGGRHLLRSRGQRSPGTAASAAVLCTVAAGTAGCAHSGSKAAGGSVADAPGSGGSTQ